MIAFIDENRSAFGVESICAQLPIAPSVYYKHKEWHRHPDRRSLRSRRDEYLEAEIKRVYEENYSVYGARKVWRQLVREGVQIARCSIERLMRVLGLQGITRGKKVRTTFASDEGVKPKDLINREFEAQRPNQLWVADFTYVATWTKMVYVAFVIDVFSRFIVGWRAWTRMTTELVLDALEQAIWNRRVTDELIHHSDRGKQYLSIRYTERLTDEGIKASAGSVGDAYDNAMAETIIGLYKAEVIQQRGPWKTVEQVERATFDWVDWYNNRRIFEPIGNVPPAEFEQGYYTELEGLAVSAGHT